MSSKPIHQLYKHPSFSSAHAPAQPHFHEKDLPMLAVQIESIMTNDRTPISESGSNLPPLPPKKKELLHNEEGEVSPFADPKFELPPYLRPGFINVRQSTHRK